MPKLKKSRDTTNEKALSPKYTNNKNKNFTRPKSSYDGTRRKSTNTSYV